MRVAVIGANGGIGRELLPRLDEGGHEPIGVVRDDSQFDAISDRGAEPRLGDLEGEFAPALEGADAVVFTAGSGGNTGWDKTLLIDLWGARRTIDACVERGIDRFVTISSRGAGDPLAAPAEIRPYLVAKRCADDVLEQSPLDETILRPTALTDDDATGRVASSFVDGDDDSAPSEDDDSAPSEADDSVPSEDDDSVPSEDDDSVPSEGDDSIPRADVAQAVVACLENEDTIGNTIGLYGGDTPVETAVRPES